MQAVRRGGHLAADIGTGYGTAPPNTTPVYSPMTSSSRRLRASRSFAHQLPRPTISCSCSCRTHHLARNCVTPTAACNHRCVRSHPERPRRDARTRSGLTLSTHTSALALAHGRPSYDASATYVLSLAGTWEAPPVCVLPATPVAGAQALRRSLSRLRPA
jgi:hypothetical protein